MTLPSDKEQKEILRWQDEKQKARDEDGPTTQKINKKLSEREQHMLQQIAEVWNEVLDTKEKVNEIAPKVVEHDGFMSKVKRAFGGVVK